MTILLRIKSVTDRVGLSKSQVYKMIAKSEFPAPIKVASKVSAWSSDHIDLWIQQQIEGG